MGTPSPSPAAWHCDTIGELFLSQKLDGGGKKIFNGSRGSPVRRIIGVVSLNSEQSPTLWWRTYTLTSLSPAGLASIAPPIPLSRRPASFSIFLLFFLLLRERCAAFCHYSDRIERQDTRGHDGFRHSRHKPFDCVASSLCSTPWRTTKELAPVTSRASPFLRSTISSRLPPPAHDFAITTTSTLNFENRG